MAESVVGSVELSRRHDVREGDLQIVFGEGAHFSDPPKLRSIFRS